MSETHPPSRHPTRPSQPEHLPCPRCESTNTKFCYYNNYNLSQPRYFCKSCRRYWTRGGTLRNVPPGGGTRKNSNKRPRTTTSSSSSSSLTFDPVSSNPPKPDPMLFGEVNLNEAVANGGFNTLLGSQQWDGFGLGLGSGLNGLGFGMNAWDNLQSEQPGGASGGPSGCNTWQISGVEGGLSDGDCFGWPDLSISTPGKSFN